jgi:hypothetical protein
MNSAKTMRVVGQTQPPTNLAFSLTENSLTDKNEAKYSNKEDRTESGGGMSGVGERTGSQAAHQLQSKEL